MFVSEATAKQSRVLLATAGSRGDIEPFLSLAVALRDSGYDVQVVSTDDANFPEEIDVVSLGVSFSSLDGHVSGPFSGARAFRQQVQPAMRIILGGVVDQAMQWQPDVIVAHPKLLTVPVVAEHLGIPYLTVELAPVMTPSREFPAAGVLNRSLGGAVNRSSYRAVSAARLMFASEIRAARQRLGLSGSKHVREAAGSLVAVSPTLLTRPSDWPATTHLTGDWPRTSARREALSAEVTDFISDDAPFLYAGFGSMRGTGADARAETIVEGARRAGLRVLLATGWGALNPPTRCLGRDVMTVSAVPHAAVLPTAAVAMHHGGAGTVHAATRCGTPSVLVPFLADQAFWAQLLRNKGLAGAPLHKDRLSAESIRAAIADAAGRRPAVQRAAEHMRRENGPANAISIIAKTLVGAVEA